jgi:hypothetical protein
LTKCEDPLRSCFSKEFLVFFLVILLEALLVDWGYLRLRQWKHCRIQE